MLSDQHNLTVAKGMDLIMIFSLLQTKRCFLAYRSTLLNGLTSVIFTDSESVDLVVSCVGFFSQQKSSIFFTVASYFNGKVAF